MSTPTPAAPAAFRHRCRASTHLLRNLNIDAVFPIHDEVSAWLMCLKAELLYDADIINDNELNAVIERAAAAIDQPQKSDGGAGIARQEAAHLVAP
jgi:hypothetical protein